MVKLLGEELTFGNEKQRLVCMWLEEDYAVLSKIKYLKSICTSPSDKELLDNYDQIEKEKIGQDKYNRALIDIKLKNIIDAIVGPMIEKKKQYYEDSFTYALAAKRDALRLKMQKKYKGREVVLPF